MLETKGGIKRMSSLPLRNYTVATAPAAAGNTGAIIYVSDGKAGNPIVAFSNGTNWIRVDDGSTPIASS
jgi:hypothetical protein